MSRGGRSYFVVSRFVFVVSGFGFVVSGFGFVVSRFGFVVSRFVFVVKLFCFVVSGLFEGLEGEGGGGRRSEGGRREPFSLNEFPYARTTTGDCLLVVACAGTAAAPQGCWPGSVLNFALIMRCARFTQLWHTSDYAPKLTNMVFCVILCLRDHGFPRRSFPGT